MKYSVVVSAEYSVQLQVDKRCTFSSIIEYLEKMRIFSRPLGRILCDGVPLKDLDISVESYHLKNSVKAESENIVFLHFERPGANLAVENGISSWTRTLFEWTGAISGLSTRSAIDMCIVKNSDALPYPDVEIVKRLVFDQALTLFNHVPIKDYVKAIWTIEEKCKSYYFSNLNEFEAKVAKTEQRRDALFFAALKWGDSRLLLPCLAWQFLIQNAFLRGYSKLDDMNLTCVDSVVIQMGGIENAFDFILKQLKVKFEKPSSFLSRVIRIAFDESLEIPSFVRAFAAHELSFRISSKTLGMYNNGESGDFNFRPEIVDYLDSCSIKVTGAQPESAYNLCSVPCPDELSKVLTAVESCLIVRKCFASPNHLIQHLGATTLTLVDLPNVKPMAISYLEKTEDYCTSMAIHLLDYLNPNQEFLLSVLKSRLMDQSLVSIYLLTVPLIVDALNPSKVSVNFMLTLEYLEKSDRAPPVFTSIPRDEFVQRLVRRVASAVPKVMVHSRSFVLCFLVEGMFLEVYISTISPCYTVREGKRTKFSKNSVEPLVKKKAFYRQLERVAVEMDLLFISDSHCRHKIGGVGLLDQKTGIMTVPEYNEYELGQILFGIGDEDFELLELLTVFGNINKIY